MEDSDAWILRAREFKAKVPKPRVWILTPCFGGHCFIQYVTSLIRTIEWFRHVDIHLCIEFCRNDSLVSRARNNMVARAMYDPLMTHVLFIDNDISWSPTDILRLLFSGKDIVGGVYPQKQYNWSAIIPKLRSDGSGTMTDPIKTLLDKYETSIMKSHVSQEEYVRHHLLNYNVNYLTEKTMIENNLCRVRHIATGFMMIRREVLTGMMAAFPSTKYVDDVHYLRPEENDFAYALFDCGVEEGHYYSEDWMFCHRWSKMGGSIYMDIGIKLTHTGTEDYQGFILSTLV